MLIHFTHHKYMWDKPFVTLYNNYEPTVSPIIHVGEDDPEFSTFLPLVSWVLRCMCHMTDLRGAGGGTQGSGYAEQSTNYPLTPQ